jgi:hypothetical protein
LASAAAFIRFATWEERRGGGRGGERRGEERRGEERRGEERRGEERRGCYQPCANIL